MAKARWFVGVYGSGRTTFKTVPPVSEAYWCKRFGAVIGPFRTKRGAEYMARYGTNNPQLPDVASAEKWAAIEAQRAKLG